MHMVIENWIGIRLKNYGNTLSLNTSHWDDIPDFSLAIELPQGRLQIKKNEHLAELSIEGKDTFKKMNVELLHEAEKRQSSQFGLVNNTPLLVNLPLS